MSIPVSILREGKYFVAYTPALDISTYGETLEITQKSIHEAVEIFLDEMLERGTLIEELKYLGWEFDKKNKIMAPPVVIEHSLAKVQIPNLAYA